MKPKLYDKIFSTIYELDLKQRLIIALALILLIGYFLYSFIISAQVLNLRSLRRQYVTEKNFIQSKKDKARNLLLFEERYKELQAKAYKNNQRFFSDEESIDFLKQLNSLIENQTGNNLVSIRPVAEGASVGSVLESGSRSYKIQDVQVTVRGRFANIFELFKRLYELDKLVRLKEVNIKKDEQSAVLSVDFYLSLYLISLGDESNVNL